MKEAEGEWVEIEIREHNDAFIFTSLVPSSDFGVVAQVNAPAYPPRGCS